MIRVNIASLDGRVRKACEKANRDPSSVRILPVSKGHSSQEVTEAYQYGLRDFGENYAVEMAQKMTECEEMPDIAWHYIGRVQSNKLQHIAKSSWVHTLSEIRHAEALAKMIPSGHTIKTLLQVNFAEEAQRSGVKPNEVLDRYQRMKEIDGLNLCGLMTIAPINTTQAPSFWFEQMRDLKAGLEQGIGVEVPELSMGMSSDFEEAILFGATWIRVGTLIFGERHAKSKD